MNCTKGYLEYHFNEDGKTVQVCAKPEYARINCHEECPAFPGNPCNNRKE
jgi:hypothetical protein